MGPNGTKCGEMGPNGTKWDKMGLNGTKWDQKGFEYLLVFRLNHVISLSTETGDMSVDIDGFFVFDSLQHRICKMKMLKIRWSI